MSCTDITRLVQRMEALESRYGIRYQSIYAYLDTVGEIFDPPIWNVYLNCEIISASTPQLSCDIETRINLYDDESRIIATDRHGVYSESFYAFSTLTFFVQINVGQRISIIRLYPEIH